MLLPNEPKLYAYKGTAKYDLALAIFRLVDLENNTVYEIVSMFTIARQLCLSGLHDFKRKANMDDDKEYYITREKKIMTTIANLDAVIAIFEKGE